MSGKHIDWSKYDHLLGRVSDSQIAQQIKCAAATVVRRRQKLLIEPHSERLAWSEQDKVQFLSENKIQCRKCGNILDARYFTKNKNATHGFRKECRKCHQEVIKERRQTIKKYWVEGMGGCCQNCGFKKYLGPLQFHHVEWNWKNRNPENTYPNLVMYRKYDEAQIKLELDKCCLLCANCHDAVHSGELQAKFVKRSSLGWTVPRDMHSIPNSPDEDKGQPFECLGEL
jgi:predicted HNH restriction endonuclease